MTRARESGHHRAMDVRKPPAPFALPAAARVVFLAGSIEMGAAIVEELERLA